MAIVVPNYSPKLWRNNQAPDLDAANLQEMDDVLSAIGGKTIGASPYNVGDIIITVNQNPGAEWLLCNGATISPEKYPDLYEKVQGITERTFTVETELGTRVYGYRNPSSGEWFTYWGDSTGGLWRMDGNTETPEKIHEMGSDANTPLYLPATNEFVFFTYNTSTDDIYFNKVNGGIPVLIDASSAYAPKGALVGSDGTIVLYTEREIYASSDDGSSWGTETITSVEDIWGIIQQGQNWYLCYSTTADTTLLKYGSNILSINNETTITTPLATTIDERHIFSDGTRLYITVPLDNIGVYSTLTPTGTASFTSMPSEIRAYHSAEGGQIVSMTSSRQWGLYKDFVLSVGLLDGIGTSTLSGAVTPGDVTVYGSSGASITYIGVKVLPTITFDGAYVFIKAEEETA